jgi:thiol-disulfide isomerase/thioredoxin
MLFRGCVFIVLSLFTANLTAESDSWVLEGRVLDAQGRPVADVRVSAYWNANGVPLQEVLRFQKEGGDASKFSANQGRMEPWGEDPTKTDAKGRFWCNMSYRHYFLLAIDKQQQRGALIRSDSRRLPSRLDVRLGPLVRLYGRARIAGTDQHPESVVVVHVPESDKFPLAGTRLAMCSTGGSHFEFFLPPGNYELEGGAIISGKHYKLDPFRRVRLPAGFRDVDAGTLELTPPRPNRDDRLRAARTKGAFAGSDGTKRYGLPAAKWHAVDARGLPKHAQVSDLKGKWVLVYFFGPYCAPCLGQTLPALTRFYEAHQLQRDQFEIVAVCNVEPETKTMDELDRFLAPVVKEVWHGKPLPFPLVLDNTIQTAENFGIELVIGKKLLFDPAGRLVPGDEKTLGEKLKRTEPDGPNRGSSKP